MKNETHDWPVVQRLMHRVSIEPNGCWIWSGLKTYFGYGRISVNGRLTMTHRVSYEHCVGPIPKRTCVLHKCDNPSCVNPDHLFLGTRTENMQDMIKKGRANKARGTKYPHAKLTEELVREIRESSDTLSELSRKLGISRASLRAAITGETWKHVSIK